MTQANEKKWWNDLVRKIMYRSSQQKLFSIFYNHIEFWTTESKLLCIFTLLRRFIFESCRISLQNRSLFFLTFRWNSHAVNAFHILLAFPLSLLSSRQEVQHLLAHPGHDSHAGHHVGAVCQLDAHFGKRRSHRTHTEWDHVHGLACVTQHV